MLLKVAVKAAVTVIAVARTTDKMIKVMIVDKVKDKAMVVAVRVLVRVTKV
jgi:hypothetical protein